MNDNGNSDRGRLPHSLPPAVHWHEGLFLRPHHLQQLDRQLRRESRYFLGAAGPFPWGLRHLEVDHEQIAEGNFVVRELDAVLPDGTPFSTPGNGTGLAPLDLEPFLAGGRDVVVHLCVPSYRAETPNAWEDVERAMPEGEERRWQVEVQADVLDENTGDNEQALLRRRTVGLLAGRDRTAEGFVCMPIARVKQGSKIDATTVLDHEFYPPSMVLPMGSGLRRRCERLLDRLEQKSSQLAEVLHAAGGAVGTGSPGDLESALKLLSIQGSTPVIRQHVAVEGTTPLRLYEELCAMAGRLLVFARGRALSEIRPYDHWNLTECFHAVFSLIATVLDDAVASNHKLLPFRVAGAHFSVEIDPAWFSDPSIQLFVVVDTPQDERAVRNWVTNFKVGRSSRLVEFGHHRIQGIRLGYVMDPPPGVKRTVTHKYFAVARTGRYVDEVKEDRELCVAVERSEARDFQLYLLVYFGRR